MVLLTCTRVMKNVKSISMHIICMYAYCVVWYSVALIPGRIDRSVPGEQCGVPYITPGHTVTSHPESYCNLLGDMSVPGVP